MNDRYVGVPLLFFLPAYSSIQIDYTALHFFNLKAQAYIYYHFIYVAHFAL